MIADHEEEACVLFSKNPTLTPEQAIRMSYRIGKRVAQEERITLERLMEGLKQKQLNAIPDLCQSSVL